jgi:hypothetical protein
MEEEAAYKMSYINIHTDIYEVHTSILLKEGFEFTLSNVE